ncbi:MAG: glycosyltransferase family 2 protein [Chitinophagaceae bacterium]|nr:glycosyltransferase family 2 protein [Chitinophagaceae bacterium]
MKTEPLISIVTVNYNQCAVTADMLRSLAQLTYKNYEVIVVDNASVENSASLKNEFPFITHITSPSNTGFAGGNNLGLFYAKGDYVFLVNNDTEVTPGLLNELVSYMTTHAECAIACPKIKYFFKPDTIQYAGTVGPNLLTSRSYDIGYMQKDDGSFNDRRVTDQPNGAAMMIPMKLIKQLGPMSELFFLYYEELDWAARFKKAGYEVHYVGTASIYHKESVSTGKNSAFKTFYLYRNRLLYIRRNYNGINRIISGSFFTMISTPVHMVKHVLKGDWQHAKSIAKALIWNLTHSAFKEPATHSSLLKNQLIIC